MWRAAASRPGPRCYDAAQGVPALTTHLSVPVPLREDRGVLRVGDTRVALATVVALYDQGATPEEIAYRFPPLHVADLYAVISYYLSHPPEIATSLGGRNQQANAIWRDLERQF